MNHNYETYASLTPIAFPNSLYYTLIMNFTLFGYPKTGKTTLFNLLTGAKIEVKAYESGKKEPNLRTCPVPDLRLEKIWSLSPEKETRTPKPAVRAGRS